MMRCYADRSEYDFDGIEKCLRNLYNTDYFWSK